MDELSPKKKEADPGTAFLWLLVELAPIPMLLLVSPSQASPVALLIICPLCNLLGGIGCLGGIKNVAVRIISGLALGALFFGLTLIVALFQACSHSSL